MDHGSGRIKCLAGEVRVDLYAAVWSDYTWVGGGRARQNGPVWHGDFTEQSGTYDQTNRAVVKAGADNTKYEIMMVSYDR